MAEKRERDYFDDEAEESNDEEFQKATSDTSDEDDNEDNGEDVADLIDDNEYDDGRPKKRRKKVDDRLDDEDYDVIRENTGISVPKKRYHRVKMFDSDEEEEEGEGEGGGGKVDLVSQVFGASDDEDEDDFDMDVIDKNKSSNSASKDRQKGKITFSDDDDFDGFIVGDDGRPIDQRKGGMFSEPALMEAQEIFGVDFNPADFGLASDDEDANDENVYRESDDEAAEEGTKSYQRKKSRKNRSIYDVYEPSELERSHFTDTDKTIRVVDVPERFQLRSVPIQNSEEGELDSEADWIYHQAFCSQPISRQPLCTFNQNGSLKPSSAVPKIKEALNFMRNYSFEVPFIATYRKEYIEPELNVNDLWKIFHWDLKWTQLQQRKNNLKKLFKDMQSWQFTKVREEPEKALTEDYHSIDDEDIGKIDIIQTEEELSDVYSHFMLYYGGDLIAMKNRNANLTGGDQPSGDPPSHSIKKQAKKQDFYVICQEAGLGALAAKFGLTPRQFGENLRDNYQRHETDQHPYEPEEAAQEFIQPSGYFESVRSVLQGACHMVTMQIASEPLVRQVLRQVYQTRGMVNVYPTKKGKKVIDENHLCFSMKYLKNKPVREFKGEEFLILHQAESDGLLNLKISIDIETTPTNDKRKAQTKHSMTFLEEIRMMFYRDEFSMLVEKWNAQRAQSVAQALMKVLYPQIEKEIKAKLLTEAKEHVIQSCVDKFRQWLDTGPPQLIQDDNDISSDSENYHPVLSIAYSDDWNLPSFGCFLNGFGEVVDYIRLNHIQKKMGDQEKEKEMATLKQSIMKQVPSMVVIAATSRTALLILDELKACVHETCPEQCSVVEIMDPSVPSLCAKLNRYKEAYPSYPDLLRIAVSSGRYAQEPLYEMASLCESSDDEILSLRLHHLQMAVPQSLLKERLELEIVTKVNQVGVNINFCIEHPHAESILSFVSGFGPRKAVGLLKNLRQENIQLQNRSQLVTQCSIGPQVFINCAGFIKISPSTFGMSDSSYVEILDSTRIHPETYEWARKMAIDALEYDETGDESNPSAAVEDVMETPEKLRDLDLDAFADELERQEYGNKRATLYDIRDELFAPFKDHRVPFNGMSAENKFALLISEPIHTIYIGKLITCTVTGIARKRLMRDVIAQATPLQDRVTGYWQCPFCLRDDFPDITMVWPHFDDNSCPGQAIGVRTKLENNLNGFISVKNLSDNRVDNPESRVQIGMTLHSRIIAVNYEKLSVDLSCRSSDLKDDQGKFGLRKDMYYDYQSEDADNVKKNKGNEKTKQKYMRRVIVHPCFMNITYVEACDRLKELDQGDAIFRPSSQSDSQLTLSWKVTNDIYQHISILEKDKPNVYSLGKTLIIGKEEFEDLDEILARFVQPIAANVREVISHKSYSAANGGDRKQLEKILHEDKSKNPRRIPYFLSASKQYPGKMLIAYQPSTRAKFEYISVVPEGYIYRGLKHSSLTRLINWFKGNYNIPVKNFP